MKELRLRGIDDFETANAFLPTFMADYNARFAVEAGAYCPTGCWPRARRRSRCTTRRACRRRSRVL